jgi:two-component system, chemotaxis family, chemotaxis protein CheY
MELKLCLIVDDSPGVRKIARRFLEQLNFQVEEAVNGQLALEMCAGRMPAAILLDWNMPVMTGIEFLRSLRGMDGGKSPVVVFCTTEDDVSHIREALEAGANEYVIKPFDAAMLREKFSGVLAL